jgi:NAD(P)H-hydrate epimerase
MRILTAAEMAAVDRRAIDEMGIPGARLMERAGSGTAEAIRRWLGDVAGLRVLVLAGPGNNGGDGFVIARRLHARGAVVRTWLAGSRDKVKGDALLNLRRLEAMGLPVREIPPVPEGGEPPPALARDLGHAQILVDALLGTGSKGEPRGIMGHCVEWMNSLSTPAVAVDLPTGIDGDTGDVPGSAVVASLTVTFAYPKRGLVMPPARNYVGTLRVEDIGLSPALRDEGKHTEVLTPQVAAGLLPLRVPDAHKGAAGRLAVIAGSPAYTGAGYLATAAAVRAGAGLVYWGLPHTVAAVMEVKTTEVMTHALPAGATGGLAAESLDPARELVKNVDACVIGPGVGRDEENLAFMRDMIRGTSGPVVVDADGVVAFAGRPSILKEGMGSYVLTPHPGEMSVLTGRPVAEIQADRIEAARAAARESGSVMVLKGAGTVVAAPDGRVAVNPTGNAGMATGGSGDVLSGAIGAFLAARLSPWDAARLGVYLHGLAGDLMLEEKGVLGLKAGDLVEALPRAVIELGRQRGGIV